MSNTFHKPELENVVAQALVLAKQQGATAEASLSVVKGFSVTVRLGEVETIEHNQDKSLEVTVYLGKKTATVSTSDFSPEALNLTIEKACHIAKLTNDDPYSGLPDKKMIAFNYPDMDLYHPWNLTPAQAIELAKECEAAGRMENKRITNSEGATVSSHDSFNVFANTHDFMGSYPRSNHSISCAFIADDGHQMERDYDYTVAVDAQDMMDIHLLARRAALRTARRLGAKKLSTRQCPVIYEAEIARGLLRSLIAAASGTQIYRNASFLLGKLNQKIFPDFVHIDERPHLPKMLGSAPFDEEGVSTKAKDIIKDGRLVNYLMGSYSARKLGMQSTGNAGGVYNLFINSTVGDLKELLKKMNTGLLVTELIGQGINLVTGDYSKGAFGFWVENGEIQYPVHEITIAGNLKEMFSQVAAIAGDVDHRANIQTGSVLIEEMMVAGK